MTRPKTKPAAVSRAFLKWLFGPSYEATKARVGMPSFDYMTFWTLAHPDGRKSHGNGCVCFTGRLP